MTYLLYRKLKRNVERLWLKAKIFSKEKGNIIIKNGEILFIYFSTFIRKKNEKSRCLI